MAGPTAGALDCPNHHREKVATSLAVETLRVGGAIFRCGQLSESELNPVTRRTRRPSLYYRHVKSLPRLDYRFQQEKSSQ